MTEKIQGIFERNTVTAWDKLTGWSLVAGIERIVAISKAGTVVAFQADERFEFNPRWLYDLDRRRLMMISWQEWRGLPSGTFFQFDTIRRDDFPAIRSVIEHARRFWVRIPRDAISTMIKKRTTIVEFAKGTNWGTTYYRAGEQAGFEQSSAAHLISSGAARLRADTPINGDVRKTLTTLIGIENANPDIKRSRPAKSL